MKSQAHTIQLALRRFLDSKNFNIDDKVESRIRLESIAILKKRTIDQRYIKMVVIIVVVVTGIVVTKVVVVVLLVVTGVVEVKGVVVITVFVVILLTLNGDGG